MFSENPKSKFWSDRNEKNPDEVALNSHKKFWFDCECGHEFESSLLNINQGNNWCGFCSYPPKKLCDDENCKMCFNNSFESHPKSIHWSYENELKPRQVFKNADRKKFKFNCECGHKLDVNLKALNQENKWCKYCAHQELCENLNCKSCFNNSFASVERSKYWSEENKLEPRQVFKISFKKIKFICEICNNNFEKYISDVTNKDSWCPSCFNKTELKLSIQLTKYYNIKRQFKTEWCKNTKYLPFDFVIDERRIIIELDGPQHFKQVSNWISPEINLTNDLFKMDCANKNGFSVIRILQEDVLHDRYDWLSELINKIELISDENIIQNIFMCKNDEYKNYL
jgi:very-short-patch-repair endonuclease